MQSNLEIRNVKEVQWCQFENQQSPVYVVNSHFSRSPDDCWEYCHNFALLNNLHHIWELSNEVLYAPVSKMVSTIQQVEIESSTLINQI